MACSLSVLCEYTRSEVDECVRQCALTRACVYVHRYGKVCDHEYVGV